MEPEPRPPLRDSPVITAAGLLAALIDDGDGDAFRAVCAPAEVAVRDALAREAAETEAAARVDEAFFADASLETCTQTPVRRVGVSGSRSQGHYGVNSVVLLVRHRARPYALKGIICAYGPFRKTQGAQLRRACTSAARAHQSSSACDTDEQRARTSVRALTAHVLIV